MTRPVARTAWHPDRDPGVPMTSVAAEVVADWARAAAAKRWARRPIRLTEQAAPQQLAVYGLSRETLAARTRLLAKARRGDEQARRTVAARYGVRVFQQAEREAYR